MIHHHREGDVVVLQARHPGFNQTSMFTTGTIVALPGGRRKSLATVKITETGEQVERKLYTLFPLDTAKKLAKENT